MEKSTNVAYSYADACRNITTQWWRATQFFRKIYLSLYLKGFKRVTLLWEGVGDRTEMQHIYPHSYGHNSVSFPFSWAAGFLYRILSPTHLIPNWLNFQCTELYNSSRPPSSYGRHKSHSFNPSTFKVIFWYSSTGCTQVHFLFWLLGLVGGLYTTQIRMFFRNFLGEFWWFTGLLESVMLWIDFSEADIPKEFSQFQIRCDWKTEHHKH